jgi:hypothetical protein
MSTQAPAHWDRPALQLNVHWPLLQLLVASATAGHFVPQPPQFCGSVLASTQASPHFCRPAAQSKLHLASWQLAVAKAGALQILSHAPQFWASLFTSTHDPSHEVFAPHSVAHFPAWHTSVAAHA